MQIHSLKPLRSKPSRHSSFYFTEERSKSTRTSIDNLATLSSAETSPNLFLEHSVPPPDFTYFRCSSINKTVERYQKKIKDLGDSHKGIHENTQILKDGGMSMTETIEHLENSRRKLLGDELDTCSLDELRQLENQLERSLEKIRARKNQMFTEQIEKLKEEEKCLLQVNKRLREQYLIERGRYLSDEDLEVVREKKEEEVETELFIGRR